MTATEKNICINVTDETNRWNRIALALCRDQRRSFPELLRVKNRMSDLLVRYEHETRDLEKIYEKVIELLKESDEQGHGA